MRLKRELAQRIGMVAGSLLVALALLELGCRVLIGGMSDLLRWPNIAAERMGNRGVNEACAYTFDGELG